MSCPRPLKLPLSSHQSGQYVEVPWDYDATPALEYVAPRKYDWKQNTQEILEGHLDFVDTDLGAYTAPNREKCPGVKQGVKAAVKTIFKKPKNKLLKNSELQGEAPSTYTGRVRKQRAWAISQPIPHPCGTWIGIPRSGNVKYQQSMAEGAGYEFITPRHTSLDDDLRVSPRDTHYGSSACSTEELSDFSSYSKDQFYDSRYEIHRSCASSERGHQRRPQYRPGYSKLGLSYPYHGQAEYEHGHHHRRLDSKLRDECDFDEHWYHRDRSVHHTDDYMDEVVSAPYMEEAPRWGMEGMPGQRRVTLW